MTGTKSGPAKSCFRDSWLAVPPDTAHSSITAARQDRYAPFLSFVTFVRSAITSAFGALDGYADALAARYFTVFVDEPIHAKFECDTERLLRWLLKLLYNGGRATVGHPIEIYRDLRPFIPGEEVNPPFPVRLLAGIMAPSRSEDRGLVYPAHHGFADIGLQPPLSNWVLLSRGVFLNSYFFHVFAWRIGIPRPERKRILAKLAEIQGLVELRRPTCSVAITKAFADTTALMRGTFAGGFKLA